MITTQEKSERPVLEDRERYRISQRVTITGAIINIILSVIQLVIGLLAHSQALVADAFHSMSDLISDVVVLWASHHASLQADHEHPYGHGRMETMGTLAVGGLLILVSVGIIVGVATSWSNHTTTLSAFALIAVVLTILGKEGLYQYTHHIARKIDSDLLRANAWHHRSDAVSSVIVLVGVGGNLLGIPHADGISAIIVGLMVGRIGWQITAKAIAELVDTALNKEQVEKICQVIEEVPGVKSLHSLRTRQMGSHALADVHILVDPTLTVSEAHQIGEMARITLTRNVSEIKDVIIHIDPEDDEFGSPSQKLPNRTQVMEQIIPLWQSLEYTQHIYEIKLHYLGGKIHLDLIFPIANMPEIAQIDSIERLFQQHAATLPYIGQIKLYYGNLSIQATPRETLWNTMITMPG